MTEENKVGNISESESNQSDQQECPGIKDEPVDRMDYTHVKDDKLKETVYSKSKSRLD